MVMVGSGSTNLCYVWAVCITPLEVLLMYDDVSRTVGTVSDARYDEVLCCCMLYQI
jgi:hypothetical protein